MDLAPSLAFCARWLGPRFSTAAVDEFHAAFMDAARMVRARAGRESADERHIAPLQLEFIRRCILLYSNPGELVLSPFGGIGSEPYVAVKHGRRAVSCELKPSYWQAAVNTMRDLDAELSTPSLLDALEGEPQ